MLLRAGAHVDRSTLYGYTPLALAARVSADASAELGWRQRHVAPDGLPTTPVSDVIQGGHAEVVKVLLEATANVDKPTPHGYTPLALAARVSPSGGIVM